MKTGPPASTGPARMDAAGDPTGGPAGGSRTYPQIDADLIIGVDAGSGGSANGRLTGTGHRFRFEVDRPDVFFAATSRPVLSAVAARMAEAGLSGEVHGPRGRVGGLDPNRTTRIGALLTGSPHIAVDPAAWSVVARTALPALRRRGIITWAFPLGFSVAGLLLLRLRRRATGCRSASSSWTRGREHSPVRPVPAWSWWVRRSTATSWPSTRSSTSLAQDERTRIRVAPPEGDDERGRHSPAPVPVTDIWDWQMRGACRGMDSALFFHPEGERGPARAGREAHAKQICSSCPVLVRCRAHALAVHEPYRVWGGLSEAERDEIVRAQDRTLGVVSMPVRRPTRS